MPFVYQILLTIARADLLKEEDEKVIPSVAAAYALLLHHRNRLSAFQRLTSAICLEGHLSDEGLSRLNKLGITQSPRSKLNLQDECRNVTHENIAQELQKNPLVKIIGDNLDIYIRTAHERQNKHNTDLHMFASNMIFARVARPDLSKVMPIANLEDIKPETFMLHGEYKRRLLNAYEVLISKMCSSMFTYLLAIPIGLCFMLSGYYLSFSAYV